MKKLIATVIAMVMALTLATSAFALEPVSADPTRIIICDANAWADAQSAQNLADVTDYPVVLVNEDYMSAGDLIAKYPSVCTVYIIGGDVCISDKFEMNLEGQYGVEAVRLAGATRLETNDAVVAKAQEYASPAERLSRLETIVGDIDARFKTIESRLDSIEANLEEVVTKVNKFVDFVFDETVEFSLDAWNEY